MQLLYWFARMRPPAVKPLRMKTRAVRRVRARSPRTYRDAACCRGGKAWDVDDAANLDHALCFPAGG